jgi:hypothetical protein
MIVTCPKCDKSMLPMLARLEINIGEINTDWNLIHDCKGRSKVVKVTGKEITLQLI